VPSDHARPRVGGSYPRRRILLLALLLALVACGALDAQAASAAQLTVSLAGGGNGSVTSDPTGIDCPATTCSASFTTGSGVILIPTAGAGSVFGGWSGGGCSGTGTCHIDPLNSDTAVTATFYPLTTISVGSLNGQFFTNPTADGAFTATPSSPVLFTQSFPVVNFNPPSAQLNALCAVSPPSVSPDTRPINRRRLRGRRNMHDPGSAGERLPGRSGDDRR
jgi:hypothetical protein